MRIFAISVVKNEEDIIALNLEKASQWAHKIFIYDNGSTDRTWEIVQSMANEVIVPWKTDNKTFYEGIRGEVYREFRNEAKKGDWWCFRLDADEFYFDNPNKFLTEVPEKYHFVCSDTIEYQFTYEDAQEQINKDELNLDKLRYYLPKSYSEARFFRHRRNLNWEVDRDRPRHIGIVYPAKIRIQHYQYRSLSQVESRLRTRTKSMNQIDSNLDHLAHWNKDKKEILLHRQDLVEDQGDGIFKLDGCRNNHLHKPWVYWIKRLGYLLRIFP